MKLFLYNRIYYNLDQIALFYPIYSDDNNLIGYHLNFVNGSVVEIKGEDVENFERIIGLGMRKMEFQHFNSW